MRAQHLFDPTPQQGHNEFFLRSSGLVVRSASKLRTIQGFIHHGRLEPIMESRRLSSAIGQPGMYLSIILAADRHGGNGHNWVSPEALELALQSMDPTTPDGRRPYGLREVPNQLGPRKPMHFRHLAPVSVNPGLHQNASGIYRICHSDFLE